MRAVEHGELREIESSLRSREDEIRQSPSAASTTSWRQYDCVAPVTLRGP